MKIRVRLYGELRGIAGADRLELDLPAEATVEDALLALTARIPALRDALKDVAFAVEDRMVDRTEPLKEGQELALLPPVSGG